MIAPHPYFPGPHSLFGALTRHAEIFDAIERNAMYTASLDFNRRAERWARAHDKPMVGNGDVHRFEQLGLTYSLVDADRSPAAICAAVAAGAAARCHPSSDVGDGHAGRRRHLRLGAGPRSALAGTRGSDRVNGGSVSLTRLMLNQLLHDILKSRVYDVARETPLDAAPRLSRRVSNEVLFKREDQQPVFSFKLRGAYNKIAQLSTQERARGHHHGQRRQPCAGRGALGAQSSGCKATIVMPQTTPQIKVDAVRAMGAEVVLAGDSYSDAKAHCDELVAETGLTFIHPFDDPLVIAGQGTIGAEILRHSQDGLSAIFVPDWRRRVDRRHRRIRERRFGPK